MNRRYSSRNQMPISAWRRRIVPLFGTMGCLSAILGVVVLAAYFNLKQAQAASRPLVLINSPLNGDELETGQRVTVQAIARDKNRITRIELWVNNQLLEAEASNLPNGITPFPILTTWQPQSSGAYTLTIRAFNSHGERGQASIDIQVNEFSDRDIDGVADELDICPDVPGTSAADGCPDRDGDSVPDANDACPDEHGIIETEGCPSSTDGDRDGDGTLNEADACPDELGLAGTEGCPDSDRDGVADSADACPGEAGWVEHEGCPTPGDSDGDGFLDEDDMCPHEYGVEATWGCPDADSDGVRDREDLCPAEPGLPENRGCPDTDGDGVVDDGDLHPVVPAPAGPDSDGDGAPDADDPCPLEYGEAEDGYCPPPVTDEISPAPFPGLGDLVYEIPEMFIGEIQIPVMVELQALELEVSGDYDSVWCYAGVNDHFYDQYGPFDAMGARRWDIADYMGPGSHGVPPIPIFLRDSITINGQCLAEDAAGNPFNLGMFVSTHSPPWDGHIIVDESNYGDPGHSFQVTYRLCSPSCENAVIPAPLIHTQYNWLGRERLVWAWNGVLDEISGYAVYIDGARTRFVDKSSNSVEIEDFLPACGEVREIQVTATDIRGGLHEERQSPRSNVWRLEGDPCPLTARVTFLELHTHELPNDLGFEYCATSTSLGPIYGGLRVSGTYLRMDTGYLANWLDFLAGVCLHDNRIHSVQSLIDACNSLPIEAYSANSHQRSLIHCPTSNFVDFPIGPEDYLTFGATLTESDPDGTWYWLFNGDHTLPPLPPGATGGTYTISDSLGYMDLIVQVEILDSEP